MYHSLAQDRLGLPVAISIAVGQADWVTISFSQNAVRFDACAWELHMPSVLQAH